MTRLLSREDFGQRLDLLRDVKFDVLSHGYVQVLDAMGSDRAIIQAARTTASSEGKGDTEDIGLLRYLLRHRHTTPIEMCELKLLIFMPMDCHRQHVRHRMATINEFSSRYSEVPDVNDRMPTEKWRLQSTANRQGSSGDHVSEWPEGYTLDTEDDDGVALPLNESWLQTPEAEAGQFMTDEFLFSEQGWTQPPTPGEFLSLREKDLHKHAREVYEERLKFGVAKEVARKDLCLSQYTLMVWKIDLHNLLHYLGLRMDKHAQLEIRSYANIIGDEIVSKLWPVTWEAFKHYRLNAMTLTELDQRMLQALLGEMPATEQVFLDNQIPEWAPLVRCRERDECLAKFRHLGLVWEATPVSSH